MPGPQEYMVLRKLNSDLPCLVSQRTLLWGCWRLRNSRCHSLAQVIRLQQRLCNSSYPWFAGWRAKEWTAGAAYPLTAPYGKCESLLGMETKTRLSWPEWMPPLVLPHPAFWGFNAKWVKGSQVVPLLTFLMCFSQSPWQQRAGHSLFALGGMSSSPGTDCSRGGNTALPSVVDWSRLHWCRVKQHSWNILMRSLEEYCRRSFWERKEYPNPSKVHFFP